MSVPDGVRQQLRETLGAIADQIGWLSLPSTDKSRQYEAWTRDPEIGGLIARFIPLGDVRVYLKDTLLKDFARHRLADDSVPRRVLGITPAAEVRRSYEKPHGRQLKDGRIISWGQASAWKAILMITYERAYGVRHLKPFGVALTHAVGTYKQPKTRQMVERAAHALGIERVVWLEQ
jgi:hypothetical protein